MFFKYLRRKRKIWRTCKSSSEVQAEGRCSGDFTVRRMLGPPRTRLLHQYNDILRLLYTHSACPGPPKWLSRPRWKALAVTSFGVSLCRQMKVPAQLPAFRKMDQEACVGRGGRLRATWSGHSRVPGPRRGFQVGLSWCFLPQGRGTHSQMSERNHLRQGAGNQSRRVVGSQVLTQAPARARNRISLLLLLLRTPGLLITAPWASTFPLDFFLVSSLAFSPLCFFFLFSNSFILIVTFGSFLLHFSPLVPPLLSQPAAPLAPSSQTVVCKVNISTSHWCFTDELTL